MDVSHLLEVAPAPRAVLDRLVTHRHRVRFQVRRPKVEGGEFTSPPGADAWEPVTWGQFALQIRGVARWLVEHEPTHDDLSVRMLRRDHSRREQT